MLGRFSITTILVALPLLFIAPNADAAWGRLGGNTEFQGYCPDGTCSKGGTRRAYNVKTCKKENCPKGYKDAPR